MAEPIFALEHISFTYPGGRQVFRDMDFALYPDRKIGLYGPNGSGKTTFLGALSNYIPPDERLITIEDNAELKIQGIANLVRLEAKMANMEGATSITIRDLIKTALRMRPDRIIVGEVRGGEAVDMLQAFICTI